MPNNSKNSINNFSPNFRDALLTRNILTDTVKNSSLDSWLYNINNIADIGDGVGNIKSSPSVEVSGPTYRAKNSKFNKNLYISKDYKGFNIPYISSNVVFPSVSYAKYSTAPVSSPTNDGPFWRDSENTILNIFKGGGKEYSTNEIISYETVDTSVLNSDYMNLFGDENNPESDAVYRRDLSVTQNQFKPTSYERISLALLPFETNGVLAKLDLNPNVYAPTLEAYTRTSVPATGPFQGGNIRQFGTTKNTYLDVPKQSLINLNTDPVPTGQHTSYIDYNNAFVGGAASTQLVNVIGSALGGGGVGFDPNSGNPVPDFDIRSSLAGRALTATGLLDDTRLGQISPKYLAIAIGNNIAFNIQEETIGRVNTSLASLAGGGNLIAANNRITVRDGILGGIGDILERMTGAKYPKSSLDTEFFSYDTKNYIGAPNITRANGMLKNTGSGTFNNLAKNINSNTLEGLIGKRGGFAPIYERGNDKTNPNAEVYALSDGEGGITDILSSTDVNSPIPQSSSNLSGIIDGWGFTNAAVESWTYIDNSKSFFIWGDVKWNKSSLGYFDNKKAFDKEKKSLLYKTQQLFNSGNMKTLVSGKGIGVAAEDASLITTVRDKNFMSKGSGVLKGGGVGITTASTPDEIFVRAWSPVDKYQTYKDLQKNSALTGGGRKEAGNISDSVLDEFGMVKITPYGGSEIKKFMFSIENLAWDKETSRLLECEIGPGDPLTGAIGRIMWFPPYDITFNESTSANWERSNFIGRGEPIYTYNNTERTGTLSWKIVVDHPNYLNFMKDKSDDEIAAFFAGALSIEEVRDGILSADEKAALEAQEALDNPVNPEETTDSDKLPPFEFNVYYPNNISEPPTSDTSGYEDGLIDGTNPIDYTLYPTGVKFKEDANGDITTQIEKAYGEGTIKGDAGTTWTDNTNFGLHDIIPELAINPDNSGEEGEGYFTGGWMSKDFKDELDSLLEVDALYDYSVITVTGYASAQGSGNDALAKDRANKMVTYIKSISPSAGTNKKFKVESETVETGECVDGPPATAKDSFSCKTNRFVTVKVEYDPSLKPKKPIELNKDGTKKLSKIPYSRFYKECDYFKQIGADTDSFISKDLKSKIKNFHPGFHSITPEGFNSRLTFLQQCMRQGPTTNLNSPDNLAFGKPPVCILRIGDFYNTKIIIESLTIDYDPLVWDLNPEGVGVQPMIANVNISFAFIGGSSLKGPINRLQNAISFNYFANTELYDPRADRIKINESLKADEKGNASAPQGEIIDGQWPYPKAHKSQWELDAGVTPANPSDDVAADLAADKAAEGDGEIEPEEEVDSPKIIGFESIQISKTTDGAYIVRVGLKQEGFYKIDPADGLNSQVISDEDGQEFFSKGLKITLVGNLGATIRYEEAIDTWESSTPTGGQGNTKGGRTTMEGGFYLGVINPNLCCGFEKLPTIDSFDMISTETISVSYEGVRIQTIPVNIQNNEFKYFNFN